MASSGSSCWCYRCNRFVGVRVGDTILCPDCGGGFVEAMDAHRRSHRLHLSPAASEIHVDASPRTEPDSVPRARPHFRNAGDRSPFNPVIVLRAPIIDGGGEVGGAGSERGSNYELYYDDGTGSGLQPLPASASEFLMGSGFDHLLQQLAHLEISGAGRFDHPPASKAAIESLPTIKIAASYVVTDSHCAVCKEPFELDVDACEMPCKHIYHSDCILPWLSIRNSCPVCRHELPTEVNTSGRNSSERVHFPGSTDEDSVGLIIWRLPGRGFAVGRFTGGRQAAERGLPAVFTEMDGGFNAASGAPRRIAWATNGSRARVRSGVSRAFHNFFSLFRRFRFSSYRFSVEIGFRQSDSHSVGNNRPSGRHSRGWALDDSSLTS